MKRVIPAVLVVAAVAAGIVAVAARRGPERTGATASAPTLLVRADERKPAPVVDVRLTTGEPFRLADAGGRPTVLSFLAQGCESCAQNIESLAEVKDNFAKRGVEILVIDVSGPISAREITDYYASFGGGSLAYASDADFALSKAYNMRYLGQTVVIDKAGRVAFERVDPPASVLTSAVASLLDEA